MYGSFPAIAKSGQSDDRPFACTCCSRSFKRVEHLRRHVRTRTVVPYPYIQQDILLITPADTKEKPYACHCGMAFTRKDLLKRHVNIVHSQRNLNTDLTRDLTSLEAASPAPECNGPKASDQMKITSKHSVTPNRQPHQKPPTVAGITDEPLTSANACSMDQPSTQGQSYLEDIASYLDSLGSSTTYFDFGCFDMDEFHILTDHTSDRDEINRPSTSSRPASPFGSWLPPASSLDRCLSPVTERQSPPELQSTTPFYDVSAERCTHIETMLDEVRDVTRSLPGFSRHAWTRYLTSFWEDYQPHMPFIHLATTKFQDLSIEEILAYAAMGAQYRFEHGNASRLFYAGKAIVLDKMRRLESSHSLHSAHLPVAKGPASAEPLQGAPKTIISIASANRWDEPNETELQRCRTLLGILRSSVALLAYAAWETAEMVQEALKMQNIVAACLRYISMKEDTSGPSPTSWADWAWSESCRRAQLVAFCWTHTLSIAYNHPPVMMCSEIGLRLPCAPAEWFAETEDDWKHAFSNSGVQPGYQEALALLMSSKQSHPHSRQDSNPLGNYTLLHGLIQKIYLIRELGKLDHLAEIENALRNWTSLWQAYPDSNLDPKDEGGPIPFTSSALLGMAYVRLHLNTGPNRRLGTRDPKLIGRALYNMTSFQRDSRLMPALLHATHSLSIPVRLGIDYVARSQALYWSVRHALGGFECAIFLSKWLLVIDQTNITQPPSGNELSILQWVRRIVKEARMSIAPSDVDGPGQDPDANDPVDQMSGRHLSLETIRLWSRLFRLNTQWPFINVMGLALEEYAGLLECEGLFPGQEFAVGI